MTILTFTNVGSNTYYRYPGVTKGTVQATGGGAGGITGDASLGGNGGGGGEFRSKLLTGMTAANYTLYVGNYGLSDNGGENSYWDAGADVTAIGGYANGNGGTGGIGTTGFDGGSGGANGSSDSGGGGGGGAGDSAGGGSGGNGSSGVGGSGGGGGATGGGNGGDGGSGDAASGIGGNVIGGGGGGGGSNASGGTGARGQIDFVFTHGTLEITQGPTNANNGAVISPSMTVRIKDSDSVVDTNADTAGAGNTITVSILTGPGVISGTTTRTYGAGTGTCTFNDIVITGAGTYTLRFMDNATSITVDSSSFEIIETTKSINCFIRGYLPSNSGCDLFEAGSIISNSGINLYEYGLDVKSNSIPLYTLNSVLESSGIDLYVRGLDSFNGAINLYQSGPVLGSGNIDLYTLGLDVGSGNIDLFIRGLDIGSGNLDLFTAGHIVLNSSINLFITGNEVGSSGINLYQPGPVVDSSGIDLYTYGIYQVDSSMNLFLQGQQIAGYGSGSIPLNLFSTENSGMFRVLNLRTGYQAGTPDPRFSLPLYMKGPDSYSSGSYMNLFVCNDTTTAKALDLYVSNNYVLGSGGINLFITTPSGTEFSVPYSGAMNLFVARDSEGIDAGISLFLKGSGVSMDSINLFTDGTYSSNSGIDLYMRGLADIGSGNIINLFSHGF